MAEENAAKWQRTNTTVSGHMVMTLNPLLGDGREGPVSGSSIPPSGASNNEAALLRDQLAMIEQHYENQQDLHQRQQEYWNRQQDTTRTQMAALSAQHSELIETMKKVPWGGETQLWSPHQLFLPQNYSRQKKLRLNRMPYGVHQPLYFISRVVYTKRSGPFIT